MTAGRYPSLTPLHHRMQHDCHTPGPPPHAVRRDTQVDAKRWGDYGGGWKSVRRFFESTCETQAGWAVEGECLVGGIGAGARASSIPERPMAYPVQRVSSMRVDLSRSADKVRHSASRALPQIECRRRSPSSKVEIHRGDFEGR